ncbi:MAG TPA: bifunctional homocysteine S-methyltransferase/methylenetetrahydrofolate reductase [Candidatus Eremiobacteraeota bacterium]|nr:bifunctional homocysteine S-methyltransferase/methylenetetrahydrofolate reductase [Candidatus Eremiobacteraeota bacterium]
MKNKFLDLLDGDGVVIFDGGMGTEIYRRGIYINRSFDELNLSNPGLILEIHKDYINSGADVIQTNTFGANLYKLKPYGFSDKVKVINYEGAKIARQAAGHTVLVAGSIGPLGVKLEPWGTVSLKEAREAFKEQAQALLEGGVDLFVIETFSDLGEIHQAISAVKEICDLPVVAEMTIDNQGNSLFGTPPEVFVPRLDEWGTHVIGINCSVGPQVMLEVLERMVHLTDKPISIIPNAGVPVNVEGRNIYLCSPEYMATYAKHFILSGAKIVGGCCGTEPEHIHAIKKAVIALRPKKSVVKVEKIEKEEKKINPVPRCQKSAFAKKITEGQFVTSVELLPPRGYNARNVINASKYLKEQGVDVINIPDGPRASARMSPLCLAVLIEEKAGIETVLHYCCRDRNLLGMQADILGAYSLGLRNILIITGDPPKMGTYPDATAVFDVDSIGLTRLVSCLNHGYDLGKTSIEKPTGFFIGVGVDPNALDPDYELRHFDAKVEAGAEFVITQPVFDVDVMENFLPKIEHYNIPVIAGIWPFPSYRNALFMQNEVPGVTVPEEIMKRMKKADEEGRAMEEGLLIARETLQKLMPVIQGAQVSAPFGKYKLAMDVIREVKCEKK